MNAVRRAEGDSVLNTRTTSRATTIVILLCASVALLDGFDTQVISLAAPTIGAVWHLKPSVFGSIFGIGLFGGLIGATVAGMLGDRIGRKPLVIFGVLFFGVVTLVTPFVGSVETLEIVRFFTGLGLGAALPGIVALTSEYSPARSRTTVVAMMWCGFPMGAVVGGVVANWLIPDFGWASVFYAGGVTPLLLLPALAYLLPESARFLIVRGDTASASKATARMGIRPDRADPAEVESESTRLPVTDLFRHGYGPGTLLLWAAMFLTLVMTYFLVTWLPTVAALAGAHSGLLAVSTLNLGGIVGCLLIGRLADRRTPAIVLGAAYTLGAIAIALIGWAAKDNVMLLIVTGVAGLLGVGAQLVTVSLVATYYDTARRASGVGWSMGWGRLGGIVGPMLGGALIAAGLATSTIFLLAGGVCLCTALVVFAFGMLKQRSVSTQTVREAPA